MGQKSSPLAQSTLVSIRLKKQALKFYPWLLRHGFAVADQAQALPWTDNQVRRTGPGFFLGSDVTEMQKATLSVCFSPGLWLNIC